MGTGSWRTGEDTVRRKLAGGMVVVDVVGDELDDDQHGGGRAMVRAHAGFMADSDGPWTIRDANLRLCL